MKRLSIAVAGVCVAIGVTILASLPAGSQGILSIPYVRLQNATPGTADSGHLHISGTAIVDTNLGVGTLAPTSPVTVRASGIGFEQNNGPNRLVTKVEAMAASLGTLTNTPLELFVNGSATPSVHIETGFVGIGRSAPVTGAEVFGISSNFGGYGGMYIKTPAGAWPFYGYASGSVTAWTYLDGTDSNKWKLVNGGVTCMTATTNGHVGIGDNNPQNSRLSVAAGSENGINVTSSGDGVNSTGFRGGYFVSTADSGDGVLAGTYGNGAVGVYGYATLGTSYGVYCSGNFAATGTKSFQIDHPLDPENKYLNHFCTEGPEPMNAYSGNVVTDSRGYAQVELPDYFESINTNFRYQLTVVDDSDDFVLAKVARKIQNNRFVIRTNKPLVEVSWRVEAVRNDRWVQQYGFKTEEQKPAEYRGKFIAPELYDHPQEDGIAYVRAHSRPPAQKRGADKRPSRP